MTYDRDYTLNARATFWSNDIVLQQLDLATAARMNFTLFHDRASAEKTLGEVMFQHLAAQLAIRLKPVPSGL